MLSVDIYRVPQEIFSQVPEAFPTLENQCMQMNADAKLHAIPRVIAKKHFVNAFSNSMHKVCWTEMLTIT